MFNRNRVSVEEGKVLQVDGGDGHTTIQTAKMVKFYVICISCDKRKTGDPVYMYRPFGKAVWWHG